MNTDIHPRTPIEIAAQVWMKPECENIVMDTKLAMAFAGEIEAEQRGTDAWVETAAMHCRNEEYYRGMLQEIGAVLGPDAYVCDDGSISQDILVAKVPQLVKLRLEELQKEVHAINATCAQLALNNDSLRSKVKVVSSIAHELGEAVNYDHDAEDGEDHDRCSVCAAYANYTEWLENA